jgi:hypothetical protein
MSDTPETDEFERSECDGNESSLSFARKLERARDRHQELADALLIQLGATQERMIDAERERDVAQKAMGDARDILLDAMPDANAPTKILADMIVAERDLWKLEAERWRALSLESVDEVVVDDQTAPYGEWWEVEK